MLFGEPFYRFSKELIERPDMSDEQLISKMVAFFVNNESLGMAARVIFEPDNTDNRLARNKDWVLGLRMNHYFHNLRVYDIWNPEKRLIVYYEDLLQTPQKVLQQIADFIGKINKESEIQDFVDHFDEHMDKSLKAYEGPGRGYKSQTKGRSFLYHTCKAGIEK